MGMMSTGIHKKACVSDIAGIMEEIAPACLAETWDNCGLQVGASQWSVDKIWVALDPLVEVIEAAGRHGVDLVITHHPLIFKSLKSIDLNSYEGKVIACALRSHTAVFAAHTNLDSTADGINDVLAGRIGLEDTKPLLAAAPCDAGDREPAAPIGLGRIGMIASPMPVREWARQLKKRLGLAHVKIAGNLDRTVHRVAVCSGSGSSLMDTFLSSDADVYVSGDLRYHDARAVEDSGRAFVDIGHFASEHLIIDPLVRKLKAAVEQAGWDIGIEPCSIESDPFSIM
jgi:dinuclear metal center YbgI/SA1388 family protein